MVIIFTTSFSFGNKENIHDLIKNNSNTTIKDISLGKYHSSAIINDGTSDLLYTWGRNDEGELGLGDNKERILPTLVTELPSGTIKQVSLGQDHSAAIVNDGTNDHLYIWGSNDNYKLGLGSTNDKYTPTEVTKLPKGEIKQVSLGQQHSSAITSDGTNDHLYTWGYNGSGQLGLGDTNTRNIPTEVTELPEGEIKQVSLGKNHSSAITSDGTNDHLYTWGYNVNGELGLGYLTRELSPTMVTELPEGEIKQVSLGENHSSAVVNDGTNDHLYTWGYNGSGQLGLGDTNTRNIPTEVTELPEGEIKQISLGNNHSIINITIGGIDSLYVWGNNDNGQLGLGKKGGEYNSPIQIFPDYIKSLTDASVKSVGPTTAKITVNTSITEPVNNKLSQTSPYSLEVIEKETDNVIGKSDAKDLSEEGVQTFNLTNLTPNKDYGEVEVTLVGDHDVRSNAFNLKTSDKKNISSLSNVQTSKVTMNSTSIKVDTSIDTPILNEDVNNYSLEVVNENTDEVIGKSDATDLMVDGTQTFNLTELTPSTSYKLQVTIVGDHDVRSEEFDLTTLDKKVTDLEELNLKNVDAHTATFSVNVLSKTNVNESEKVNKYTLEVVKPDDTVLGVSGELDQTGTQTFTITGLDSGTDYGEVKIWLKNDNEIVSDTKVSLTTMKESVTLLSNAKATEKSYDTATISVDVAIGNNHEVEDYKLKVTDSSTNRIWISKEPLTEDGTQTIELDDLYWGYDYDNLTIEIEGLESSKVNIKKFRTDLAPIAPDGNSFKLQDGSIKKDSFIFSIKIIKTATAGEEIKVSEIFDPMSLHLLSNGKELKLNFLHSGDGDIYTYKAFDLKSHSVYDNLEMGIENDQNMAIKINTSPIKTKKNMIIIYGISLIVIIFIIITIIIVFIIIRKKRSENDFASSPISNSFF